MDREGFRNRLKQYKKAREENPGLKYWEWKNIPKYDEGTDGVTLKEKEDAFWRGDTQKMAELVEREGKQLTYVTPQSNMDEVVVTANKPKQNAYSELDFAKDVVGFTPLGDVIDLYDAGKELYKGNYANAAILGAGLLVPNWIEKSGKLGYRYLRKMASKKFGASNVEFYENLGRDVLTKPKEVIAARKDGRYPLTFNERKAYLKQFHEADDYYRKLQMDTNKEDYWYRQDVFPDNQFVSTDQWRRTTLHPNTKLNLKSTVNGRSYHNFANPFDTEGVNNLSFNINSHVRLRRPKSNILEKPENVAGTAIHERQHSVSNNLPDFDSLKAWSPEMRYFTYGGERGIVPELERVLLPINKNAGINDWASNPDEWFSEAMEYRVRGAEGKPFREMSEIEREGFINFMHNSLGDNLSKFEIAKILADGSTLGYF